MINIDAGGSAPLNMSLISATHWISFTLLDGFPSYVKLYNNALNYVQFNGSGLTYSSAGRIASGTISSISEYANGSLLYSIYDPFGASWSAPTLGDYILAGNNDAINTLLFSGDNIVRGSGFGDNLFGLTGADQIIGAAGNDVIDGGIGNDRLDGDSGNDTIYGGDGNDLIYADGIPFYAYSGNDAVYGGAGNDTLHGGQGLNTLAGGIGNDTYDLTLLTPADNTIVESVNEGIDTIITDATTFSLASYANVENVVLASGGNFTVTGNALNNIFKGELYGSYTIDGGGGVDLVSLDFASESGPGPGGTQGLEPVIATINQVTVDGIVRGAFTNVERLQIKGGSVNDSMTGGARADIFYGNGGADTLDGGVGADTLVGGAGHDVYVVDSLSDIVTEISSAHGYDRVQSSVSWTLGSFIERLTLTGSANINGTGNTQINLIEGNTGNNILNGGLGADTVIGGDGNDVYYVDNAGDVVTEAPSEGTDAVFSSVAWTLGADFENLGLTGIANLAGAGNALDNLLLGNAGNNFLNGGLGADRLQGGLGNDLYIVDNAGDVITEAASAGTDIVRSAVSHTLSANVENLALMGTANLNGVGNMSANSLSGNAGANVLAGGGGNDVLSGAVGDDTLYGGGGADWLYGGAGADAFVFNTAFGALHIDSIMDYSVADDTIWLEDSIFASLGATGALTADMFRIGAAAADANDHIIYNATTGALFYDSNGNGAGSQNQIATLTAGLALTASDFLVV